MKRLSGQIVGGCSKEKGTRVKSSRSCVGLYLCELDGSDAAAWSKDKQAVFHEAFSKSANCS